MKIPSQRHINPNLKSLGFEAVLFDVMPLNGVEHLWLRFDGGSAIWRQGVWLGTDGLMEVNGQRSSQFVLWQDNSPEEVEVTIVESDGVLRLYNVWNSGRMPGHWESQGATSGMLVTEGDHFRHYECSDSAKSPTFDKLLFTLRW